MYSHIKIGDDLIEDIILTDIEVIDEVNQHNRCVVCLRQTPDIRPNVEQFLGQPLEVTTIDQEGIPSVAFSGFILEAELEYEISGSFVARLSAISTSYRMDLGPRESYWRQKTLKDVAPVLAGFAGISASIDCAARSSRNYVQWGETDFSFLLRIADDHQAWVRPTAEGIEIRDAFEPGPTVQWRAEGGLLGFKVIGKLGPNAFEGTHYSAYSMLSKTLTGVKSVPSFTGASQNLCDAVVDASGQMPAGRLVGDERAASDSEYETLLRQEHERSLGGGIVAKGVSRLDKIRAGSTVVIAGGLDAHGTYGVFKVVHKWTPQGYENEFSCTPCLKYVNPQKPVGARIHGVVAARVVSQNDEKKMGRLQIRYDWQSNESTSWARMATPHAGGDRGFLFLPEVGDEVLVAFEQGDPERPFILGSLWNGVDKAPREEFWGGDVKPNDVKRIVTKSGHRIQLNDTPGKEAIVIATPSKLKISLLEKAEETGRPMMLLHAAEGDVVFNAPAGRIHLHSKYFTTEIRATAEQTTDSSITTLTPGGSVSVHSVHPLVQPIPVHDISNKSTPHSQIIRSTDTATHWAQFSFVDKASGLPIPYVMVVVTLPNANKAEYITNYDGTLTFRGLPDGTCDVSSKLPTRHEEALAFSGVATASSEGAVLPGGGVPSAPSSAVTSAPPDAKYIAVIERHKVKTGAAPLAETISDIANTTGVPVSQLMEFNWGPTIGTTYRRFDLDLSGIVFVPKPWQQSGLALDKAHVFECSMVGRMNLINNVLATNGVVLRPNWAKYPLPSYETLPLDWWYDTVVIHHTGNEVNPDPLSVETFHYTKDHYVDVGYHFIIDRSGQIYEGRDLMFKGQHVAENNTGKIGIVLTGDYEHQVIDFSDDELSAAQQMAIRRLIASLVVNLPTLTKLGGHQDYIVKAPTKWQKFKQDVYAGKCPGKVLYDEIPNIRRDTGLGGP